ncbi:unnamed protein product [Spodoptera exigua]|nr:unnamed protein product [Spodoptera exigua]
MSASFKTLVLIAFILRFQFRQLALTNRHSLCSRGEKVVKLKKNWQENIAQFDQMKKDLRDRQKAIMEFYALMRNTHQKMTGLGHKVILPPPDDLHIMNVAKLTADQLLHLCSVPQSDRNIKGSQSSTKTPLTVDLNKLYNMPSKLVATCEQTLFKRKEIIDWFETLKTEEKGIGMHKLSKKINEFNAENEMLKCSLGQAKGEFLKELTDIIEFLRKTANDTVALQLRIEELTCELSDLNSQNCDLRKQIHNSDHLRSQINKNKVEELEKELKEEKCKKIFIKDRLSRAEGQIKMGTERASQLEAALEQARSQIWTLERTVQQLHDQLLTEKTKFQNRKLQTEFDNELNKLRESIRENTTHLEEIGEAREKLQAEKEDLEKRLGDLSNYYNESLQALKHDMNINVAKHIETEKKYEEEREERKKVEERLEAVCNQLLETELGAKELAKELQETRNKINNAVTFEQELLAAKRDLEEATTQIKDYRTRLNEQSETIKEFENNIKESISLEETLKNTLFSREEYIAELEKKQSLLEHQLQESRALLIVVVVMCQSSLAPPPPLLRCDAMNFYVWRLGSFR